MLNYCYTGITNAGITFVLQKIKCNNAIYWKFFWIHNSLLENYQDLIY